MSNKTYEDGLVEGKIKAIEDITAKQSVRLDSHSTRLTSLERMFWIAGGVIVAIQAIPLVQIVLKILG